MRGSISRRLESSMEGKWDKVVGGEAWPQSMQWDLHLVLEAILKLQEEAWEFQEEEWDLQEAVWEWEEEEEHHLQELCVVIKRTSRSLKDQATMLEIVSSVWTRWEANLLKNFIPEPMSISKGNAKRDSEKQVVRENDHF